MTGIPPVPTEPPDGGFGGHADAWETSLVLHLQEILHDAGSLVHLGELPPREVPIHYREFSIVDGPGFSRHPDPDRIVRDDPRDADAKDGARYFGESVLHCLMAAREALKKQGLG